MIRGRCNCGGVAFEVDRLAPTAALCWCAECRRASGYAWAGVSAPLDAFRLTADATLRWWRASPRAERGFCARCGGYLFWRPTGGDAIDIALGCLEGPSGATIDAHIHTAEAGDYAAAADLPRHLHGRGG